MRLKSFRAATVAEAMQQVREHFGENAIIVSTQRNAGQLGVRVTAAIEELEIQDVDPSLHLTRDPLDPIDVIAQALDYHNLPSILVDRLLGIASNLLLDDPQAALAVALDAVISFDTQLIEGKPSSPILFVGPAGSGKTLTLAKLAVRAVMQNQPIHVVTTDLARAGGYEQLAAFTQLLGYDLHQAEDKYKLQSLLAQRPPAALTLIDSAAVSPFDPEEMQELQDMIETMQARTILVLPGGLDPTEAIEIGQAFQAIGCQYLLVTQLDRVRRCGCVVALAITAQLSLCGYTHSPHVTKGLDLLNPFTLAGLILENAKKRESYNQMRGRPSLLGKKYADASQSSSVIDDKQNKEQIASQKNLSNDHPHNLPAHLVDTDSEFDLSSVIIKNAQDQVSPTDTKQKESLNDIELREIDFEEEIKLDYNFDSDVDPGSDFDAESDLFTLIEDLNFADALLPSDHYASASKDPSVKNKPDTIPTVKPVLPNKTPPKNTAQTQHLSEDNNNTDIKKNSNPPRPKLRQSDTVPPRARTRTQS